MPGIPYEGLDNWKQCLPLHLFHLPPSEMVETHGSDVLEGEPGSEEKPGREVFVSVSKMLHHHKSLSEGILLWSVQTLNSKNSLH